MTHVTLNDIWSLFVSMIPNMVAGAIGYSIWSKVCAVYNASQSKK